MARQLKLTYHKSMETDPWETEVSILDFIDRQALPSAPGYNRDSPEIRDIIKSIIGLPLGGTLEVYIRGRKILGNNYSVADRLSRALIRDYGMVFPRKTVSLIAEANPFEDLKAMEQTILAYEEEFKRLSLEINRNGKIKDLKLHKDVVPLENRIVKV